MQYRSIWDKVLNPGEDIKFEFSIGNRYRLLGFILGVLCSLIVGQLSWGFAFFFFLFVAFYFGFYLKVANVYAFTDKRVLIHTGWLSTKMVTADYGKITDVKVVDPFFERIIANTGSLTINTAGGSKDEIVFGHIETPYEAKKKLDELRHHI